MQRASDVLSELESLESAPSEPAPAPRVTEKIVPPPPAMREARGTVVGALCDKIVQNLEAQALNLDERSALVQDQRALFLELKAIWEFPVAEEADLPNKETDHGQVPEEA